MGVSAHVDDSLNPCKPLAWEDLTSKKEPKQDPFKKKNARKRQERQKSQTPVRKTSLWAGWTLVVFKSET